MLQTRIVVFSLVIIWTALAKNLFAQNIYLSKEGIISVTATHYGLPITAHSKQVEASLDYETSNFVLRLIPSKLHTGIDSLDKRLKQLNTPLILRGNLNLGEIVTTSHRPRSFQLTGMLETVHSQKVEVEGMGILAHINGGEELACELVLYFDVDARSLGLHNKLSSSEDQHLVKVQFLETILKKEY